MRVIDNVLNNISPSNIFLTLLFPARFEPNCQVVLTAAARNINGLGCSNHG